MLSTEYGLNMRGRQEKIFNLPPVVLWIVALLVAIEGFSQFVSPESYLDILRRFAFVPGRFTFAFDPARVTAAFNAIPEDVEFRAQAASFFLGDGRPQWWTPLTYAFLHGGWLHVGMNCLWFAAFGSAVARRFGAPRFLLFCVVAAIAGALMHYLTHMADLQPVVGASATVSGVMAAAMRFVFQPGAPLGESLGFAERAHEDHAYRQPALPLREILSNRSAISFLGFWFLANFLFGALPIPLAGADTTVAWEAHIGGFLVGLLAFRWFDPPAPSLSVPLANQ
jgi:membrane associated rhomboid family serine protease